MTKDPVQVEKKESSVRVFRGGCRDVGAIELDATERYDDSPGDCSSLIGFRPVRNLKEKVC